MTARTFTFIIATAWLAAAIVIVAIALINAAHAADMRDCKTYANRGSAAALRQLLAFPFIDVAAGRFLFRKAYSFCTLQDEVPPLVFTPEEQPIVDGAVTPLPPMKPEGVVPATGGDEPASGNLPPDPTNPAVSSLGGKPLCVKYGKRTVYHGKHWRCVK